MKMKLIFIGIFCLILLTENVSAENPYGEIYTYDVYYNDKLLPGTEVAKPTLKIGEPFKVKIEMTLNQNCSLFMQVCSLGGNFFEVVDGPSKFGKTRYIKSVDPGKHVFEWTIKPTAEWAGGSIPLNFWYQINLPGEDKPVVNSKFTIAYPYILNEYYKGEAPTPKDQKVSETEPSPTSKPVSMLGFSLVIAIVAFAFVFLRFSRH